MNGHYMPDVLSRTMVTNQCWLWLGGRDTKGYGQISRGNKSHHVHRIAYESAHGEVPSGLVLDHICHDPAVCAGGRCVHRTCVNPAHLRAVTNAENLQRQTPAAKTHCLRGHALAGDNLGTTAEGRRYCMTCRAIRSDVYAARGYTVHPSLVRAWARENGLAVRDRGALARPVVEAWNAAHPDNEFRVIDAAQPRAA